LHFCCAFPTFGTAKSQGHHEEGKRRTLVGFSSLVLTSGHPYFKPVVLPDRSVPLLAERLFQKCSYSFQSTGGMSGNTESKEVTQSLYASIIGEFQGVPL